MATEANTLMRRYRQGNTSPEDQGKVRLLSSGEPIGPSTALVMLHVTDTFD